jgi:alginate O-acetyltransferase complex protein AlgI
LLGFFKYLPSLGTHAAGLDYLAVIAMPIGMSFWTFQALSYLFDVYREEELAPSLLEFCLYMAFWPTVISGPICRLPEMLPQFRKSAGLSIPDISAGIVRVIQGLFMKLILAQVLARVLVTDGINWGGFDVWFIGIGFGFLLFFDFAGYSHIVIGAGRIFGFHLPENFARPFFADSPSIFWTRWHISLSTWIRDYLFIPLATARRVWWWPHLALVISMTLFGVWHGATVAFLAWGLYHGLLLVAHRFIQQAKAKLGLTMPGSVGTILSWATTFSLVSLGWIFFRAKDTAEALSMFRAVLSPAAYLRFEMPANFYVLVGVTFAGYFAYEFVGRLLSSVRIRSDEHLQPVAANGATSVALSGSRLWISMVAIVNYIADRFWWWFAPTVLIFGAFVGAVYREGAEVGLNPFIYALF